MSKSMTIVMLGQSRNGNTSLVRALALCCGDNTMVPLTGHVPNAMNVLMTVEGARYGVHVVHSFADYRSKARMHGDGYVITYKVTDVLSWQYAQREVEFVRAHEHDVFKVIPIAIVGTQCDVGPSVVPRSEVARYAASEHAAFFETSARSGQNVHEAFLDLAGSVLSHKQALVKEIVSEMKKIRLIFSCCIALFSPLPNELLGIIDAKIDWRSYIFTLEERRRLARPTGIGNTHLVSDAPRMRRKCSLC